MEHQWNKGLAGGSLNCIFLFGCNLTVEVTGKIINCPIDLHSYCLFAEKWPFVPYARETRYSLRSRDKMRKRKNTKGVKY